VPDPLHRVGEQQRPGEDDREADQKQECIHHALSLRDRHARAACSGVQDRQGLPQGFAEMHDDAVLKALAGLASA
jgi:hypothetical protein